MREVCYLCGSKKYSMIHKGVRGNDSINVLKCSECGLVRLSDFPSDLDSFYKDSVMRKDESMDFNIIRNEAMEDDQRRYHMMRPMITNKSILDFGCGAGGFLEYSAKVACKAYGVEPEDAMRSRIRRGITCYPSIQSIDESLKGKLDVITMWHVLEHLEDPSSILGELASYLSSTGKIIIEVPNADDALITLYDCTAFQDFTYWEAHLYLFTNETLRIVVERAGLRIHFMTQIQRYPISNHLYWLTEGKPGGHAKWSMMDSGALNRSYGDKLVSLGIADTILAEIGK